MSHFTGLVVMTPRYAETHTLDDALERYDENIEVPEYSKGEVELFEKITFYCYYKDGLNRSNEYNKFYCEMHNVTDCDLIEADEYRYALNNKDEFGKWFVEKHPEFEAEFESLYAKNGNDWNGSRWRKNYATGKFEDYSRYNPNSKWDWYEVGGRWDACLKTKSEEFTNECMLDELDWNDPVDEDEPFHFSKSHLPFAIIVDGEWIEKGEMGWWAITTNEKGDKDWNVEFNRILDNIPKEGTEVYLIDFHI